MSRSFFFFPKCRHIFYLFIFFTILRFGYYELSDGFSIDRIRNRLGHTEELSVPAPSEKEHALLNTLKHQKFTYLAKGSQAYAFASSDGEYVLKLFKCHHLQPAEWLEKIPLGLFLEKRQFLVENRRKRLHTTLSSYTIAAKRLRDECALVSMQILPNEAFDQVFTIVDRVGQEFSFPLSGYGFALQKRGQLIFKQIETWIENNELNNAKKALQSIVTLIIERSLKGIRDTDPDLHKNAGLIGTKAIFIDLGGFQEDGHVQNPEILQQDVAKITNNLYIWLQTREPELALFLQNCVSKQSIERVIQECHTYSLTG